MSPTGRRRTNPVLQNLPLHTPDAERLRKIFRDQHEGLMSFWLMKTLDMVLHCPKCGMQHIDRRDTPEDGADWNDPEIAWTNPPHRSHLCAGCGHIWRPADVPTNGVQAVKTAGKNDSPLEKS